VKALPRICRSLIEHGMDPSMPAATIRWGTLPRQRTVTGTIADLPARVAEAGLTAPAMTIVGRVVALRPTLNWFETRPFFGQTVVITRTRQQASELSRKLAELGANVIEAPTIELVTPAEWTAVDEVLRSAGAVDWIVFTSQNGVEFTKRRLFDLGLDARAFGNAKIAAIGDATTASVRCELCLSVDLCPESFVAEALADALVARGEVRDKRFLLLRADIARPVLRERLRQDGAGEVRDVAIYETRPAEGLPPQLLEALTRREVQWVTFTSSSTATNFVRLLGEGYGELLAGVRIASIGPVTSHTLRELGLQPTVEADTFNIDGLVAAMSNTAGQVGD
jgi:uroporphyrinogen III methyltransferase/synthase